MAKNILITGSNSGIGKLTAKLFAQKGWQVMATMRDPERAGDLIDENNIHIYQLDVTRSDSIEIAKTSVLRDFGKIDLVVNNAGFGVYGAFELATENQIDRQLAVNVKGLMMVTKSWLPHFRENGDGMFINISSIAGVASYPLASLYIASKWAVEGFTEALYYEVKPFGVRLKLIEPGGFRTNFQTSSITWTNDPAVEVYREKMKAFRNARDERLVDLPDPIAVAQKIWEATNDPSDRLRYIVGEDAERLMSARTENGAERFIAYQNRNYKELK